MSLALPLPPPPRHKQAAKSGARKARQQNHDGQKNQASQQAALLDPESFLEHLASFRISSHL